MIQSIIYNWTFPPFDLQVQISAADQSSDFIQRHVPTSILTAQSLLVSVAIAVIHIVWLSSECNYVN